MPQWQARWVRWEGAAVNQFRAFSLVWRHTVVPQNRPGQHTSQIYSIYSFVIYFFFSPTWPCALFTLHFRQRCWVLSALLEVRGVAISLVTAPEFVWRLRYCCRHIARAQSFSIFLSPCLQIDNWNFLPTPTIYCSCNKNAHFLTPLVLEGKPYISVKPQ